LANWSAATSGAVAHVPPEVFQNIYTMKYDVYSFGILLWQLLSSQKPFENGTLYCAFARNKIKFTDKK